MKKYPTETVRLFVEDALSVTRSPGKQEVYKAWLTEHPKPQELIPSIWAREIEASLRSSVNSMSAMYKDLEQPEWLNEYLSNGSVTEYGGLNGDTIHIPLISWEALDEARERIKLADTTHPFEDFNIHVPHPETETRAYYHQFTDNPEQPSGIIEIVVDEAAEMDEEEQEDRFDYRFGMFESELYREEGD